jgi:AraC-like DNA-binding protein
MQRPALQELVAQRIGGTVVERPPEEMPHSIPIALRSVQHIRVSPGRFEPSWSRHFVQVAWVIAGKAAMGVGARRVSFGPGEVAVYLPNIIHRLWALESSNEMCWFTLDGPLAEEFALHLGLRNGVYPSAAPPLDKLMEMMEIMRDSTLAGWRRGSRMAVEMLYHLADTLQLPEISAVVNRAQRMIQQEFNDPELSAEQIAGELSYHRGSLSRLFHKQTGMTIIEYLTMIRLQQAKALLMHTDDKVASIAEKCGFRESTYFCRWLRKHTGTTARSLRGRQEG